MYGEIPIKQTCPNCKYFKTRFCKSLLVLSPDAMLIPCIKNLGILNLSEINMYLTGMFMYKIYNQDVPHVFDDFFMYNYEVHDHDTRSSNYFHVPNIKSNLSAFGIKYHSVIIWNKILKAKLNPDCSELSFKMMLKKSILQKLVACEWSFQYLLSINITHLFVWEKH